MGDGVNYSSLCRALRRYRFRQVHQSSTSSPYGILTLRIGASKAIHVSSFCHNTIEYVKENCKLVLKSTLKTTPWIMANMFMSRMLPRNGILTIEDGWMGYFPSHYQSIRQSPRLTPTSIKRRSPRPGKSLSSYSLRHVPVGHAYFNRFAVGLGRSPTSRRLAVKAAKRICKYNSVYAAWGDVMKPI
jgi:hypothetical protein